MKLFTGLARWLSSGKDKPLNRSQLVGLYLTQTNSREALTSELHQNRQRRNGKYAHTRERA